MPEHEHDGVRPTGPDLAGWDADEQLIDNSFGDSAPGGTESLSVRSAGLEHAGHDHGAHGGHDAGGHGGHGHGEPDPGDHGGHGGDGGHDHPVELVQEVEHAGHKVTVRTRFDIEIDGHPIRTHLMIRDGKLVTHALPYFSFETPLELGKSLAEHYGQDF